MESFIKDVKADINKTFNNEDFEKEKALIKQEYEQKRSVLLEKLNKESMKHGFEVKTAQNGIYMMPIYEGKTLEEIFGPKESTQVETTYTVDNTTHKITYKSGSTEKSFSYPSNIKAVKGYIENPTYSDEESITIYLIDENNDLWIKGRNSGIGRYSDEFICLTTRGYMSEEIWDTIRGRWNLIDRKY